MGVSVWFCERMERSKIMTEPLLVGIDEVIIGTRHRQSLGDLSDLIASIDDVGLLHPIVMTSSFELVAGQRRLEAVRQLGHLEIDARILPLSPAEMLRAEFDENTVRMDFRPSEAVALGRKLEEEVAKQAAERKASTQAQPGEQVGDSIGGGKLPPPKGKTRDIVGKAIGMGGSTYQSAKRVVAAAEKDPEKFGHLVEKMDNTGFVSPAAQELKQPPSPDQPRPPPGTRPNQRPHAPAGTIVENITNGLHASVVALNKVSLNGASNEEVAGWIGDLEDPLRLIRKIIRTWKEHA